MFWFGTWCCRRRGGRCLRVFGSWADGVLLGSGDGPGQGGEAGERGGESGRPGPGGGDAEPGAALPAGEAGGDVQEPVAQRFRFGAGQVAVEQGGLGPGDQVRGGQGEFDQAG